MRTFLYAASMPPENLFRRLYFNKEMKKKHGLLNAYLVCLLKWGSKMKRRLEFGIFS